VCLALSLVIAPCASGQERSPNGEIYHELLPFVGLNGVRLEIHGFGGFVWNIRGSAPRDPEADITGLSRAEHAELLERIKADATEALRLAGIPLSEPGSATDNPARLVLTINTHRARPDAISANVTIELMERVRLLRDQERIIWGSTWTDRASNLSADSATLMTWLRATTRGQVNQFVRLYTRAHAKPAPLGSDRIQ
jgi:hypothetical protein